MSAHRPFMMLEASSTSLQSLVSVIVSAYNYGHFIGQTLESVRAQTYQNWECTVVDDASTDDTAKVVARYAEKDNRIRYIHQVNQGLRPPRAH